MGLLSPFNLVWLFGSLAVLVLIYLRARARTTIDVSSLMLFEEIGAPVVQRRMFRLDALFWLEAAALSALSLALAGLYLTVLRPIELHRTHAMVFDLGAAMGAREGNQSRLDHARSEALAIVSRAPADTRFSIIGYALGARVIHAETSDRAVIRSALMSLEAAAVAPRPAALKAALIRAREATAIDLFTDRAPASSMVADALDPARLKLHLVGAPAENIAIVSLAPGTPGIRQGHCVVRSFAQHAVRAVLTIESDRGERLTAPIVIEPDEEAVVPFGPLAHGGLVHAQLTAPDDALAADNQRWAYVAPGDSKTRALVLSADAAVRDDLSRILLGINQNLTVAAFDPAQYRASANDSYALVVMHNCYLPGLHAPAILLIFPPAPGEAGITVRGTIAGVELHNQSRREAAAEPLSFAQVREVALGPQDGILAQSVAAAGRPAIPLAAIGTYRDERVGLIAFDVRDRLLLNPDDLDALLLTVHLIKRLTAPQSLEVVATGAYVTIPTTGAVTVIDPNRHEEKLSADRSGHAGFTALSAGRYRVTTPAGETSVYANYFNEDESNLSAGPETVPAADTAARPGHQSLPMTMGMESLEVWLVAIAILALLAESILLTGEWWRRRIPRYV
ncbi:MAG: VWA domain-containing protein [Candidatus Binataceae bacterium]|nr:VWA domain-containing protein [Candidatus Binataceae bacterium]